jgi:hypothetical protein
MALVSGEPKYQDVQMAAETPFASFSSPLINESSGFVMSRNNTGVFWTHNDSGGEPVIFPVTKQGDLIPEGRNRGIVIRGARNRDWEDIACDNSGNLYIADIGNNYGSRRDLAVYVVPEPDPQKHDEVIVASEIPFFYPEQENFTPSPGIYDAEALFWAHGKLYLLTKHWLDTKTALYRFDSTDPDKKNPLTLVATHDIGGQVTGADVSPDGRKLAALTYNAVWVFELDHDGDDYFDGMESRLPIRAGQCEGVCFDGDTLIITNEQSNLFAVPLSMLQPVKKK